MAKKLILNGIVQGVLCRAYCSQYARKMKIRGSASNLRDGTVRIILDTNDEGLVKEYIHSIKYNPMGFSFYGRIDTVDEYEYSGSISGDYIF